MSEPLTVEAVYFLQPPFTTKNEQLGCYYFNILQAVEICRMWGAAIVPLKMPLAPRDNTKVELNSTDHWNSAILEIGSVDSTEVLDYSRVITITLDEFHRRSGGSVHMKTESLDISGLQFIKNTASKFYIMDVPLRWDIYDHDPNVFFNDLYPILPLNPNILNGRIPDWFKEKSKEPFLGVHWRRGDRGNSILGPIGRSLWLSTEPEIVARRINTYIEQNPELKWVYVATNSGSEYDRRTLTTLVRTPIHFFRQPANVKPLDIWKWDLTDLLLCAKTSHIMLSPINLKNSSAFGRLIFAESIQQNPETALVTFMPMI